jgi:hypothetical protein
MSISILANFHRFSKFIPVLARLLESRFTEQNDFPKAVLSWTGPVRLPQIPLLHVGLHA